MKQSSWFRYLLFGLLALLWVYGLYDLSHSNKQWDFKTYYFAAVAQERGLDPYDVKVSEQLAGSPVKLSYVYPPLTLWFFRLFTLFSFEHANIIFLILKFALLVILFLLWRRYLFEGEDDLLLLWFITLAYSSCVYWDFVSGNIGLFEQVFFWIAIIALLRKNMPLFASAIVAISFFKLTIIVFLALPLLWRQKQALHYAIAGSVVFVGYLIVNYLFAPLDFKSFFSILRAIDERGEAYNHSLLAMIRDIFDKSEAAPWLHSIPSIVPDLIYIAGAALILIASWRVHKMRSKGAESASNLETIYLACLVYALAMPRMKSYSFILLIPPTYYVIRKCVKPEAFFFLFVLLALTKWTPLPVPDLVRFLWWYFPWLAALLVWMLYLRYLNAAKTLPVR
ncbi:MAG: glycosyltransferase family 87 protein [Candidatus Zixiibacteriota bacterium]